MNEDLDLLPPMDPIIRNETPKPLKTLEEAVIEQDLLTLVFKVPQEKVPDITLHLDPSKTIGECKTQIS